MSDWRDSAACRGKTEAWAVEKGRRAQTAAALEACGWCPVQADCRRYASGHAWLGMVIGGWQAPSKGPPAKPPWA